ncbi:MAG: hypothetical protein JTT14_01310 [Candidatus Brockarchaeota archaeon]|nr:hypothetical protein [Candidatus Brockarchaeota archaeon]
MRPEQKDDVKDMMDVFYFMNLSKIIKDSLEEVKKKRPITEEDRKKAVNIFTTLLKSKGIKDIDIDWILNYK